MGLRGLIYDHDGTLIDSIDLVVEATNEALTGAGFAPATREGVMRGMVLPTLERLAFHSGATEKRIAELLARQYNDAAWRLGPTAARPYPGVASLLATVGARGLSQAMLSNNRGRLVRAILTHHDLGRWLDPILGEEDVPAPKPAGAGILAIARLWGCAPSDVLLVGDGAADAGAARSAGCRAVGVAWGTHARAELEASGFDAIIDRPEELPALLEALG